MNKLITDSRLDVVRICGDLHLKLLGCPPFLFLLLGIITIVSMIGTYLLASQYAEDPQVAALIVIGITALFLVFGTAIINGFERIAEANRIKNEFISIASHQLRSPLSALKWTLNTVLDEEFGNTNPDFKQYLRAAYETNENMILLVNDLLSVSRMESGKFFYKFQDGNVIPIVEKMVVLLKNTAATKNIRLLFETPPKPSITIRLDPEKLQMALQNIIENAIAYTPAGGSVAVIFEEESKTVSIFVKDTGIGISPEDQAKIFSKFFRAENAAKKVPNGTGLGLFVAKNIINGHGGTIKVKSELGAGSTFIITLPKPSKYSLFTK